MSLGKSIVDRVALNTNTHSVVENIKQRVLKRRRYAEIAIASSLHKNTLDRFVRGANIGIHALSAIEAGLNKLDRKNEH